MDSEQENVEEDTKYAFLLGSALRNIDAEQVLSIYDHLIPKTIDKIRLDQIKEQARKISELPEDEFSQLVSNARNFSLAPGRASMSQHSGRSLMPPTNVNQHNVKKKLGGVYVGIDNGDETEPLIHGNSHSKVVPSFKDEDSGLASCQFSESVEDDGSDYEHACFDYMPSRSQSKIRITETKNPRYDEEVKLDSSSGGSCIESPRSEASVTNDEYNLDEGTEMQTYTELSISKASKHQFWDYMPEPNKQSSDESDDSDIPSTAQPHPVEETINFGLVSQQQERLPSLAIKDDKSRAKHKDDETLDVNGNPQSKDLSNYHQLRLLSSSKPVLTTSQHGASATERRKHRKEKAAWPKADEYQDYKGNKPLEELLLYITGDDCAKSSKETIKATKKKGEKKKLMNGHFKERRPADVLEESALISRNLTLGNVVFRPLDGLVADSMEVTCKDQLKAKHEDMVQATDSSETHQVQTNFGLGDGCGKLGLNTRLHACPEHSQEKHISNMSNSGEKVHLDIGLELKREESFTEVRKKKTRRLGLKGLNCSNHFPSYRANAGPRNHTHPRPSMSPPTSSTVSNTATNTLHITGQSNRDLSPSSFPVLSGPRLEARRNSCGDISTDLADNKTLYDSDRESVKSLPVTHRTQSSPVYPISYATMVSAPRKYDSPSSESGVASGSHNSSVTSSVTTTPGAQVTCQTNLASTPERKATVWKGSPRERRHSIGSSPEEQTQVEKNSIIHRNRQKSGSQEIFLRDTELSNPRQEAGSNTTLELPPVSNCNLSATAGDGLTSGRHTSHCNNTSNLPAEADIFLSACLSSAGQKLTTSGQEVMGQKLTTSGQEVMGQKLATSGQEVMGQKLTTSGQEVMGQKLTTSGQEVMGQKLTTSGQEVLGQKLTTSGQEVMGQKLTTSGQEVMGQKLTTSDKKLKSVIFLDKRFGTSPPNLGITFGYDLSIEPKSECPPQISQVASKLLTCADSVCTQLAGHTNGLIIPTGLSTQDFLQNNSLDSKQFCSARMDSVEGSSIEMSVKATEASTRISNPLSSITRVSNPPSSINCNSLGHVQQSLRTGVTSVTNSVAVVFSPNHPPPPLPQGSGLTLAGTQVVEQASTPHSLTVVYGLKIVASKGCGKLAFLPPSTTHDGKASEICQFLHKRWSAVDVRKKDSPYMTLEEVEK
ncbi:uncharacterized protein LOC131952960 [Physella acuta]|uniref:uncharacterized protein LOC131952960 n=1 Tax=Physella acuta TaxID=109671 RepID=UPI0027DB8DA7|nr:uncharacterized protein LOC131952960 [Physella acuta]